MNSTLWNNKSGTSKEPLTSIDSCVTTSMTCPFSWLHSTNSSWLKTCLFLKDCTRMHSSVQNVQRAHSKCCAVFTYNKCCQARTRNWLHSRTYRPSSKNLMTNTETSWVMILNTIRQLTNWTCTWSRSKQNQSFPRPKKGTRNVY